MSRQIWVVVGLIAVAAAAWAGVANKAAVFGGIVESTEGGFMFPDQTVQTTAAVNGTGFQPRVFYLTNATVTGGLALTACEAGFHMGHVWEFRSLDALQYDDSSPGAFNPGGSPGYDLEKGPPMGIHGWIRTGEENVGNANENWVFPSCDKWTSSSGALYGKVAGFGITPTAESLVRFGLVSTTKTCDSLMRVWCMED